MQGALASAATETLAAASNFLIGRSFLADRGAEALEATCWSSGRKRQDGLRGFSVFGSEPVGKAGCTDCPALL